MGRAKKKKAVKANSRLKIPVALGMMMTLILLGMYIYGVFPFARVREKNFFAQVKLRETRKTMPPELFSGSTAEAYRIAQLIPQVIDSIYCYCRCDIAFGHKSLLSCYVDDHAAKCGICQKEALYAYSLYKNGLSIEEINKKIDERYRN